MLLGYWVLIGLATAISFWARARVKGAFGKYGQLTTRSGMTGAQVAQRILEDNGIEDVTIERVAGKLSDHYDPRNKVLRLSEPVHDSRSMAAFGVAAHEVGHAIQHAHGYAPLQFRSAWVPMATAGNSLALFPIIIGAVMGGVGGGGMGMLLSWLGLALLACVTIFTLVTLPVEFDASRRALVTLEHGAYATTEEIAGAKKVLDAAALTYVAAALTSLMTLAYWAFILLGRND